MADGCGPSAREELFHRTLLELGGTGDPAEQANLCRRSDRLELSALSYE